MADLVCLTTKNKPTLVPANHLGLETDVKLTKVRILTLRYSDRSSENDQCTLLCETSLNERMTFVQWAVNSAALALSIDHYLFVSAA